MELLGDVVHVESRSVHLEMVFVLVQDRCTVCSKRTGMNPLGLNPELSMRGHGITRLVDGDDIHGLTTAFQVVP